MAVFEGIRLSAEWVHEPAILESDCANVIQCLRAKADRSNLCHIIQEAKTWFSSSSSLQAGEGELIVLFRLAEMASVGQGL
uniref:RNase H type-1 domain-containing protein n=1 Tax=Leersia perrieri TaxID=77586 RepID=A0A0D9VGJ0_9ORYZ